MLIIRQTPGKTLRWLGILSAQQQRCFSKDYSSSDDEHESKKKKSAVDKRKKPTDVAAKDEGEQESAATRLNRLLASMPADDNKHLQSKVQTVSMARPGQAHQSRKEAIKQEAASKDVVSAAKRVALLLGDENDQKQTESELLGKLLGHNAQEGGTAAGKQKNQEESELSISELIVGMKIDRSGTKREESRSDFVRRTLSAKRPQQQRSAANKSRGDTERLKQRRTAETYTGSVNISGGDGLSIFKNPAELRDSPDMLNTWAHLGRHELELLVTHPPANYFEKVARWTEEGKVWRFPIDNEQDWSDEHDVDFSEHIFLEQHLEPWCPTRGPIRHFMELVCVGLSKNPYITAAEKKDHILWYRDYFEGKKELLNDLISDSKATTSPQPKQVKS